MKTTATTTPAAILREALESYEYICTGANAERARHALETYETESASAKANKERAKTAPRPDILARLAQRSEERAAQALRLSAETVVYHFTPISAKFKASAETLREWLALPELRPLYI